MNRDMLLYWMTHVWEGSWQSFRRSVDRVVGTEGDPAISRALRVWLSDLGHADFFIDDSSLWRINPPLLAGLAGESGAAVLCGARTPRMLENLMASCNGNEYTASVLEHHDRPKTLNVRGPAHALRKIAEDLNIAFCADYARQLCATLVPVLLHAQSAEASRPLANWEHRCFDFESMSWCEARLPRTVHEYRSQHGEAHYFVPIAHRKFVEFPKREALYVAANLRGLQLVSYDPARRVLRVPIAAPLPDVYARCACMCSARHSRVESAEFVYDSVPPDIAKIICVAAGQRCSNQTNTVVARAGAIHA